MQPKDTRRQKAHGSSFSGGPKANTFFLATRTGYDFFIFHRPDVYDLILSHIPAKKISFNKKVVWLLQNDEGVMIRTSDNETYHGDILVGADGAFSAVRQNLYRDMAKKNVLPTSDAQSPKVDRICLVGTTRPLDAEEYPELKDKRCHFKTVIGQDKAHTVGFVADDTIHSSLARKLILLTLSLRLFRFCLSPLSFPNS